MSGVQDGCWTSGRPGRGVQPNQGGNGFGQKSVWITGPEIIFGGQRQVLNLIQTGHTEVRWNFGLVKRRAANPIQHLLHAGKLQGGKLISGQCFFGMEINRGLGLIQHGTYLISARLTPIAWDE
jgi:hypothetical protein